MAAWLLGLAIVAASGWLLAPAISARPYLPEARDFEQALPPVSELPAARGGDGATYLSDVVTAPARFDAVGLARELRPLELRARAAGDEWSNWIEIANGDPAWFGGADELQLRTRGWRPHGTLHYVNVSGDSTAAEGLLTEARSAVNGAVVSLAGLFATDSAGAEVPRPEIIGRGAWGANRANGGCKPRERPSYGRVRALVFHHTVGSNAYTEEEAPGVVLAICRYHRNALDWNDIGYNALVDRFGNIYAGRAGGLGKAVIGAQAQGVNSQTSGVAVMGTHTTKGITKKTLAGLTSWMAWKLTTHGHTAAGRPYLRSAGGDTARYPRGRRFRVRRIIGHRKTNLTECPGDGLYRLRTEIRRRVQAKIKKAGGVVPPETGGVG